MIVEPKQFWTLLGCEVWRVLQFRDYDMPCWFCPVVLPHGQWMVFGPEHRATIKKEYH